LPQEAVSCDPCWEWLWNGVDERSGLDGRVGGLPGSLFDTSPGVEEREHLDASGSDTESAVIGPVGGDEPLPVVDVDEDAVFAVVDFEVGVSSFCESLDDLDVGRQSVGV
jgi:hypothetical protein